MSTAAIALQQKIEAQETLDAIEYGIRSINISGHAYGASACHILQIDAAISAAEGLTGDWIAKDTATRRKLQAAKKAAREQLAGAQDALKAIGTKRQLRLALAA